MKVKTNVRAGAEFEFTHSSAVKGTGIKEGTVTFESTAKGSFKAP